MTKSLLLSLIILPINVTIFIPGCIHYFIENPSRFGLFDNNFVQQTVGYVLLIVGIIIAIYSYRLFVNIGNGTPAPWNPPQTLVIRGPYRFLRNPMLASVILILFSEALLLHSSGILYWACLFFLLNNVYIPFFEEKMLTERFGDAYLEYKDNVPMWFPRLTPFRPTVSDESQNQTQSKDNQ